MRLIKNHLLHHYVLGIVLLVMTACSESGLLHPTGLIDQEGAAFSCCPSLSSDGRYITFASESEILVPGDMNDMRDIFVYALHTREYIRVSLGFDGSEANGGSTFPDISADGWQVAFVSDASNLVLGDLNDIRDAFIYDRSSGEISRITDAPRISGARIFSASNVSISADGRYVGFQRLFVMSGEEDNDNQIFFHDRLTDETEAVSISPDGEFADAWSFYPSISPDGRYVTYKSKATNLVPEPTND